MLSFGAEPEEPIDPALKSTKFKSSHDALDDPRLRKEVLDDRGTSATLPPGMEGPKRKASEDKVGDEVSGVLTLVILFLRADKSGWFNIFFRNEAEWIHQRGMLLLPSSPSPEK